MDCAEHSYLQMLERSIRACGASDSDIVYAGAKDARLARVESWMKKIMDAVIQANSFVNSPSIIRSSMLSHGRNLQPSGNLEEGNVSAGVEASVKASDVSRALKCFSEMRFKSCRSTM